MAATQYFVLKITVVSEKWPSQILRNLQSNAKALYYLGESMDIIHGENGHES